MRALRWEWLMGMPTGKIVMLDLDLPRGAAADERAAAVELARASDVAIVVVWARPRTSRAKASIGRRCPYPGEQDILHSAELVGRTAVCPAMTTRSAEPLSEPLSQLTHVAHASPGVAC